MKKIKLLDKEFELFITSKKIQSSINKIALKINQDFKEEDHLLFISILNGAFMFTSDLLKKININCRVSFLKLSSYQHGTETSGYAKRLIGLNEDIKNIPVVILEDIVDTGITIENIIEQLEEHNPSMIKVATLLLKPEALVKEIDIDYIGLEIPNEFVVGYGLDYNGLGRNFNDIYILNN